MTAEPVTRGLVDTNILILRAWIDFAELPDEMAISAITLAELSAGPHQVRSNGEQDSYDERAERARRLDILQRAESEFDPVPFGAEAVTLFAAPSQPDQPGPPQLRACLGPGCVLYFVQQHPRREWCSAGCGNRARVARHYHRHRSLSAGPGSADAPPPR